MRDHPVEEAASSPSSSSPWGPLIWIKVRRLRKKPPRKVKYRRVPVEVRFRAPFQPNVVRFLYDLENPSGRMVIDKISITSADARFRTVEVSAQITVFTRSSNGSSTSIPNRSIPMYEPAAISFSR